MWTSGVCGGGCERTRPPPPLLPTGLMKFIKGKDNGNGPYFPSATRNSTSINKADAGVALILPPPPLSNSAPFYGYLKLLKATRKGKKSKQRFEVTPRNCIRNLPRTNPLCYMLVIYAVFNHVFSSYTNVLDKRKVFAREMSSIPTRPSL